MGSVVGVLGMPITVPYLDYSAGFEALFIIRTLVASALPLV